MKNVVAGMTCKNCGAPVTSEICPYCGNATGLRTSQANMEYPTLECKEANLNFWTILFPLIFAFGFGFFGIAFPIMFTFGGESFKSDFDSPWIVYLFCLPFAAIGVGAVVAVIKPIVRYIMIKTKGKHIEAVVYGYTDDNVIMNGRPAQVVKLLVETPVGKRLIMYQLGSTEQPFGVNTTVGLIVYKNYFMIEKKKEIINW